jgi:hypothetical protein
LRWRSEGELLSGVMSEEVRVGLEVIASTGG